MQVNADWAISGSFWGQAFFSAYEARLRHNERQQIYGHSDLHALQEDNLEHQSLQNQII